MIRKKVIIINPRSSLTYTWILARISDYILFRALFWALLIKFFADISENREQIEKWLLSSTNNKLDLPYESLDPIGRMITKDRMVSRAVNSASIVLKRAENGYYVLTAYAE